MMKLETIHKSEKQSRLVEIKLGDKTLSTPTFFPAISSYGIKLPLSYLIYLLANYSYPRVLVSAYDIFNVKKDEKTALFSSIKKYDKISRNKKKGFLFLDSGVYESSWYRDKSWNMDCYKETLSKVEFDFYSSFDIIPSEVGKEDEEKFMGETFDRIVSSRHFSNKGELVAILHGRSPDHLVSMVQNFVHKHNGLCKIIAVPERDCGGGVLERAGTIATLRQTLDETGKDALLHILGCGNPLSILIYSFCGASIFDSLDWYEHVIDQNKLTINEFSQLELLNCECKACSFAANGEYIDRVFLHNLYFYQYYMNKIQTLIHSDGISSFLREKVSKDIMEKIENV